MGDPGFAIHGGSTSFLTTARIRRAAVAPTVAATEKFIARLLPG
jgi:hypothetical protein